MMCYLAKVLFTSTQDKTTPLYVASQNNHTGVVQLLLAAGAHVDLAVEVSTKYCVVAQK